MAEATGNNGETDVKGARVKKHHPKIESIGAIDELNATIGIASCHAKREAIKDILEQIQHDLFTLQAEIADYEKETTPQMVEFLEKSIETLEPQLSKQTAFILPRGNLATTHLHFARAVCRRAERTITKLTDYDETINKNIQRYLNKLSDLLHLFARAEADREYPAKYH